MSDKRKIVLKFEGYHAWIIFVSCILFIGKPDLYDALMHFLLK